MSIDHAATTTDTPATDAFALVADIGGTNARFALACRDGSPPLLVDSVREFAVADFASLADVAAHYLRIVGANPASGVFAVAGKVDGDEARITNHPWLISARQTREALGLQAISLVNDFTAQAMAISLLGPDDVVPIGGGTWARDDGDKTYAIIGPGTGLGVGGLLRRDGRYHALQSEGGHVAFAPGTPEEDAVLRQLRTRHERVSNERLISGMGLVNLHRALGAIAGDDVGELKPEDITARASQGDALALHTIALFCRVFGSAAGDLVLTLGAWDGVFLGGGLVPRLLRDLSAPGFRERFEHKGRFAPAMARVPVLAVVHPQPGLLGAAALARQSQD